VGVQEKKSERNFPKNSPTHFVDDGDGDDDDDVDDDDDDNNNNNNNNNIFIFRYSLLTTLV